MGNESVSTYLLFAHDDHYPAGGIGDVEGTFGDFPSAASAGCALDHHDSIYIVEIAGGLCIAQWDLEKGDWARSEYDDGNYPNRVPQHHPPKAYNFRIAPVRRRVIDQEVQ